MAYLIGAYQYFDDSFLQETLDYRRPKKPEEESIARNNISTYLDRNHPQWAYIIRQARRDNFFRSDPDHAYTMFVPDEETFSTNDLMNFDIQHCLVLFNRHILHGRIDRAVLQSSPIQQLSTLRSGEPLYFDHGIINGVWEITSYDKCIDNVTIHVIHRHSCLP